MWKETLRLPSAEGTTGAAAASLEEGTSGPEPIVRDLFVCWLCVCVCGRLDKRVATVGFYKRQTRLDFFV